MLKKRFVKLWLPLLIIMLAVTYVYRNHFDNEFHFDDNHTIQNNVFIQDLKNTKKIFTDATTFSNLPQNQQYRPMVTYTTALDYWMSWNFNPRYTKKSEFDAEWKMKPDKSFWFHVTNFVWFLLQLVLLYFVFVSIFNKAILHKWNHYLALFAVGWYGLHTAHAETVNYISARSDSLSTFFVVAAFYLFLNFKNSRKYFLYLIPVIIGCLFKPTAIMFAPMLFVYLFLFELMPLFDKKKNIDKTKQNRTKNKFQLQDKLIVKNILVHIFISFVVVILMYIIITVKTPDTFTPGIIKLWQYMATQPFVMLHYVKTFFLPTLLSADTDWKVIESLSDIRFFIGSAFVILMLFIAYKTALKPSLRPVSFGILWFFLALFPTTVVPLSEVMNDHRMFYPFVGLMISVVWAIANLLFKFEKQIQNKIIPKILIFFIALFVLTANAYGTYNRCEVWNNDESLWYDVTVKSPKNGRGLMNYGLTQMRVGNYDDAIDYFERAKKFSPYYSYLYINIGILKNAIGKYEEAEQNFKLAVQYGSNYYGSYYYYAQFLSGQGRNKEAIPLLKQSIKLSYGWMDSRYLLMNVYSFEYKWDELRKLAEETLTIVPNDPTALYYLNNSVNRKTKLEEALDNVTKEPNAVNYLTLGLRYYQEYDFDKCIESSLKALEFKTDYVEAYNNICSSYNNLGEWDKAIEAGEKALSINPDFKLAKGNLDIAKQMKSVSESSAIKPSYETWLNLSMIYYNSGFYYLAIKASENALKYNKNSANAYNNICSAYNSMGKWEKGIEACNKALKIDPNFDLAKNNLNWAKNNISDN